MSTVAEIDIGVTVSFRSKAVNDNNQYHGKVEGVVTADIASKYADIFTYNSNAQSADNTIPDVALQKFIMLRLIDKIDDETKYIIPFSLDWIYEASITIHLTDNTATIKVYEVNESNIADVIALLRTGGFSSRLISYS